MLVSNMPLLAIFWNPPKTALVPNRLVTIPARATEVLQNPRCKPTPAPSVDTNQINQKKKKRWRPKMEWMECIYSAYEFILPTEIKQWKIILPILPISLRPRLG